MTFTILNIFTTLFVNLFHTNVLAKRRFSMWITFGAIIGFTGILAIVLFVVGIRSETSVRAILVGSIYAIPLYYLYKVSFKKLIIIMIYCWSYTLETNAIAYGIVHILDLSNPLMYIFIIETSLILSTIYFLFRFSRGRFTTIIEKSNRTNQNILIILGFAIFVTLVGIRFYISPHIPIYFFLLVSIMIIGWASYTLMHAIVQSNLSLTDANKIAFKDSLTGINNRYSLFRDLNTLIRHKTPFILLFMDLDDLKSVNDTYDHSFGDQYLKHFAMITCDVVKHQGDMYRFAGDEFVCVISKSLDQFSIEDFADHIKEEMSHTFKYNGVSIGAAYYPKDGMNADAIINSADLAMYGDKRSKKIRRVQK